jgi:hypothetical protein
MKGRQTMTQVPDIDTILRAAGISEADRDGLAFGQECLPDTIDPRRP